MIQAWFDGVCEPKNPGGHGAYGIAIDWDTGHPALCASQYVGSGEGISNNVAEYQGFIRILEELLELPKICRRKVGIHIRGDSNLVIQQMLGNWRMRRGIYLPYAFKAQKLFRKLKFRKTILEWIPRDENDVCDKLAKDVLREMNITFKIQPETTQCQK